MNCMLWELYLNKGVFVKTLKSIYWATTAYWSLGCFPLCDFQSFRLNSNSLEIFSNHLSHWPDLILWLNTFNISYTSPSKHVSDFNVIDYSMFGHLSQILSFSNHECLVFYYPHNLLQYLVEVILNKLFLN